jgi:ribose 5-phosphate isomerase A
MSDADLEKQKAAEASLAFVEAGMNVGLGTGSTAERMIKALGEKVRAGLVLKGAVPTSIASQQLAESYGIRITTLDETPSLDVTIDGADECDPEGNLIKGGGGALLHEKIVASASKRFVVIVDSMKLVEKLGKFKVPVEIVPASRAVVAARIERMGGKPILRLKNGAPFKTQEGNLILDCDFGLIDDPVGLARRIDGVTGVVEHGLFVGITDVVVIGKKDGAQTLKKERNA